MDGLIGLLHLSQVVVGIGLVIFVHELGHYLAARICRVRVVTFSLGFGPRLLGWRRGQTLYQIAAIPLGGFCRMAGEEPRPDGAPPEPDELAAKTVGQRFFIYSGGVLMNVAFALAVFPILFRIGVPFDRPRIGETIPGSPAWHAGIEPETDVLAVNGKGVLDFSHVQIEIALGDPDETVLLVRPPSADEPSEIRLRPERQEALGVNVIGIVPAVERDEDGHVILLVAEGSAAWDAGLRTGDRLLGVPGGVPGRDPLEELAYLENDRAPIRIEAATAQGDRSFEIEPRPGPDDPPRVGIIPPANRVRDVRDSPLVRRLGIRADDRLLRVAGRSVLHPGDFERALTSAPDGADLAIAVRRGSEELELRAGPTTLAERMALADDVAVALDDQTTRVLVQPGEPAALAGMRDLDRILKIDGSPVREWQDVPSLVAQGARAVRPVVFHVERHEGEDFVYLDIAAQPKAMPSVDYGLSFKTAEYVYHTHSLPEAVSIGAVCSWRFLEDSWLTLKRMVLGQVATQNLSGIISISRHSFTLAEQGWVKLFFFLCLLSINLAFINVLPIPVLDGGHLFFLVIEKLKGSPVSMRVLGYSQIVGVVVIISLMIYVTYNDLVRWLG